MNSKRAAIGSFTVMWVSTVIVIIILMIFILGSGLIKRISEEDKGLSIYEGDRVGLTDFPEYMKNYSEFREVKFLVGKGEVLDDALERVVYDK
jgi:hypothetical protein